MRFLIEAIPALFLAISSVASVAAGKYQFSKILNPALTDGLTEEQISDLVSYAKSIIGSSSSDVTSPYLSCAELTDDMPSRKAELEGVVQGKAYPTYVDVNGQAICYFIVADSSTAELIPSTFETVPFPPLLKINKAISSLLSESEKSVDPTALLSIELFPSNQRKSNLTLSEIFASASSYDISENNQWFPSSAHNSWTSLRHSAESSSSVKCDFSKFEQLQNSSNLAANIKENITLYNNSISVRISAFQESLDFLPFLRCMVSLIEAAAKHSEVTQLSIGGDILPLNFAARGLTQSGDHWNEPYTRAGLLGQGQTVGVADSGLNDLSCFFMDDSNLYSSVVTCREGCFESNRRKVVRYNSWRSTDSVDDLGGHGTHVVGSITGKCLSGEYDTDGMARESKVAFWDIGKTGRGSLSVPEFDVLFGDAYETGARVHSNSWGAGVNGAYDSSSASLDSYTFDNKDFLVLVAAGNSGTSGRGTIGSPATAKNALTVGAMTTRSEPNDYFVNQTTIADFSSLGPTDDNRFGIDLVAPGDYIMSSMAGPPEVLQAAIDSGRGSVQSGVIQMSGTSMSTPVVAGNALMARQYLTDSKFWATLCRQGDAFCKTFQPSAAMVKAILINSGEPVRRYSDPTSNSFTAIPSIYLNTPPDEFQGYGAVKLSNVLPLSSGEGLSPTHQLFLFDDLAVSTGSIHLFTVQVANEAVGGALKVSIVWTDPPSMVTVGSTLLIHDIDLLVVDPTGTGFYGNNRASGDRNNNVEQVTIPGTISGTYSIYVIGRSVSTLPTQPVSLAMTYPVYSGSPPVSVVPVLSIPSFVDATKSYPINIAALAPAPPVPSYTSPFKHISQPFTVTLGPTYSSRGLVKIGTVTATMGELRFLSVRLTGVSSFFASIFSIVVQLGDRNVQVGGLGYYISTDRTYIRSWPSGWTADADGALSSRRDISGSDLFTLEPAEWTIYAAFGTDSNVARVTYTGTVTMEINEGYTGLTDDDGYVPATETGSSSGGYKGMDDGEVAAVAVPLGLIFLIGVSTFLGYLYFCKKRQPEVEIELESCAVPNPIVQGTSSTAAIDVTTVTEEQTAR